MRKLENNKKSFCHSHEGENLYYISVLIYILL
jgi:hypothetical protein